MIKVRKSFKKSVSCLWQPRSRRALPGSTARAFGRTPWHPVSAVNRPDRTGSTPRSLWGCHKVAAERATEGVPSEVMEFET